LLDLFEHQYLHPSKGLSAKSSVVGEGTIFWLIRDALGQVHQLRTKANYVPDTNICLFSPQHYFEECHNNPFVTFTTSGAKLGLDDGSILSFPYQRDSNLPMMLKNKHFNQREARVAGLTFQEALAFSTAKSALKNITDETNQNISYAQKELLLWHQKLCHCDEQRVQTLHHKILETSGHSHVLFPRHKAVSSCPTVLCASYQCGNQARESVGFKQSKQPKSGHDLTPQRLPGECVSIDQYFSALPGRLRHTKGKEKNATRYNGGTLFVDHATIYIHHRHQVSLHVGETLNTKHNFEKFAIDNGVRIKRYHDDNAPFGACKFRADLELQNQEVSLYGVGAHHQNGIAERAIQTSTKWAR
jgi:hypothetical protein